MSFLLPSALAIGGVALVAVIAAHFITRSQPRPEALPTARFVPDRPLRARSRTIALDDVLLLLLRGLALGALTAAVAAPVRSATRGQVRRIIALDRSRAVANLGEVRDSVRGLARAGDLVVAFDTSASLVSSRGLDSLDNRGNRPPGSLSTALAASIGIAARSATEADSIEIVLVSALARDEADDATLRIRGSWPGRLRLVRVRAAEPGAFDGRVETSAPADDPIVAALALNALRASTGSIRVLRTEPTATDSGWSKEAGHVLIHWPVTPADARWTRRASVDSVGGVVGSSTLVAWLPRIWALNETNARRVARWIDGEPAAVERDLGSGCIRDVAILLDPASDLTLRPAFRRFIQSLLVPCGGRLDAALLTGDALIGLAGTGPLAAVARVRDRREITSPWTTWLLLAGSLLLILELGLRRQRSVAA
jgi:hypothetical protein